MEFGRWFWFVFLTEKTGQGLGEKPKKTLRYRARFATTPPAIGAVTIPESMLAPKFCS